MSPVEKKILYNKTLVVSALPLSEARLIAGKHIGSGGACPTSETVLRIPQGISTCWGVGLSRQVDFPRSVPD